MTQSNVQGASAPIASTVDRARDTNTTTTAIDGEQLVRLKRSNPARFDELVGQYQQQGISDREITQAMADAPGVISPARLPPASRGQRLTAAELAEHAAEIRRLGRQVVEDVVEIGHRLAECKKLCAHGAWIPWLKQEFGWTEQTALNFMRVNELTGKSKKFLDLNLPVSALYLLAAPSTPEEAKTEIVARAEAGEALPVAEVKRVIAAHKPATKEARGRAKVPTAAKTAPAETAAPPAPANVVVSAEHVAGNGVDPEQSAEARKQAAAADEATSEAVVGDDDELVLLREFARFVINRAKSVSVDSGDHAEWKVLRARVKRAIGGDQ